MAAQVLRVLLLNLFRREFKEHATLDDVLSLNRGAGRG
jgi:hypothetical protein